MPNFAQTTLIGHLGRDPETRQVGDTSVTNFSVAHTRKRKGKDPITTWWNVDAWGKTGELAAQYLKKGSACLIVGESYMDTYEKDGQQRQKLCLTADRITFLGAKPEGEAEERVVEIKDPKEINAFIAKAKAAEVGGGPARDDIPFMRYED
jgi:single-strand DNA-binding protein